MSLDKFGVIAQLGERLHGMQEVHGSIPCSSTKLTADVKQEHEFKLICPGPLRLEA